MMLGGSELVEVGVWGRMSIADTRRQGGRVAGKQGQARKCSFRGQALVCHCPGFAQQNHVGQTSQSSSSVSQGT